MKMISEDIHKCLVLVLIAIMASQCVGQCQDPDYLTDLKNQVRPFYEFYRDSPALSPQGPCSFSEGNRVARPRWTVTTMDPEHPDRSTCPWNPHVDEDIYGMRYPCRLFTARIKNNVDGLLSLVHPHGPRTCQRHPGSRYGRHAGKLCEPLYQKVPVVVNTGCRCGFNDYTITNTTIVVGYTCTFEDTSHL